MEVNHNQKRGKKGTFSRVRKPIILAPFVCLATLAMLGVWCLSPSVLTVRAQTSSIKLSGQLPEIVKSSHAVSAVDENKQLDIVIGLRPRNQDALTNYVKNNPAPQDPSARAAYAQKIEQAYDPLPSSEQAIIAYMQRYGFSTTGTSNSHLLVDFKGTVAQAEQAFSVQLQNFSSPDGQTFYAPNTDPSVSSDIAPFVQSIVGLDSAAHFSHPLPTKLGTQQNIPNASAGTCAIAGSGYFLPNQIASIYNLNQLYNQGFHGEGQAVGLVEFDDYNSSDVSAYASCFGGGSVPITRVKVDNGVSALGSGATEVELDMELILSGAPHLAQLNVYEAPNTTQGSLDMWDKIVNSSTPVSVVSSSWSACEQDLSASEATQENNLFFLASVRGQSIFASSGDNGSTGYGSTGCPSNSLAVQDPAAQPYVTGVGGTTLTATGSNTYSSETVWNEAPGAAAGSGGGISTLWTMPDWQNAPGVISSLSQSTPCAAPTGKYCREVPDVALDADPNTGYAIYCTVSAAGCPASGWIRVGGTSASTPMWAAMTALANEKSLSEGYFNLGFLNPLLYQIGQNSTQYASAFHDVTTGNNNVQGGTLYPATTGYDMATGLGSYNAGNLADALINLAKTQNGGARQAPANTTWYFAEGAVGGSFQEFLTVLNPNASQSANLSITYLFDNQGSKAVSHTVNPSTRYTINVNNDVGTVPSASLRAVSAIVKSDVPVVVERPIYFNYKSTVPSGTDVIGATNTTQKTFYFAEGDNRQDATHNYSTYVTIMNPSSTQTATITATYYAGGQVVGSKTIQVNPLMRGTTSPHDIGVNQQVAIQVTSDIGVVVERPLYFKDSTISNVGSSVTGAASAVGATALGNDWLFAEGFTGKNFQEYLVLANFTNTDTTATVTLEYSNGSQQSVPVTVPALSQKYFDVNYYGAHPIVGGLVTTGDVSAEVTTPTASIVAERLMYFIFRGLPGGTDAVGEAGPSSHSVYAFAEGFTHGSFSEFLTLQNPNTTDEDAVVTLFANNSIIQRTVHLPKQSRTTVDVNSLVVPMAQAYSPNKYEVSLDVQALNGTIVAERPMYFNYNGSTGATDVFGYTGN